MNGFVSEEVVIYKFNGNVYVEALCRMWKRLRDYIKPELDEVDKVWVYDLTNQKVEAYDFRRGFVKIKKITKSLTNEVTKIVTNTREIKCSSNYILATDRGKVKAKDLTNQDIIAVCNTLDLGEDRYINDCTAWLYGMLCASYATNMVLDINPKNKLVIEAFKENVKDVFGAKVIIEDEYEGICTLSIVEDNKTRELSKYLESFFEEYGYGLGHIPNEVFTYDYNGRIAFIAGILDAQRALKNDKGIISFSFERNEELINQFICLLQTVNIPCINSVDRIKFVYDDVISDFAWSNSLRYKTINSKKYKLTPLNSIKDVSTYADPGTEIFNIYTTSKYNVVSGLQVYNNQK